MPDLMFDPTRVKNRWHLLHEHDLKTAKGKKAGAAAVAHAIIAGPRSDTNGVAYWPDVNDTCE